MLLYSGHLKNYLDALATSIFYLHWGAKSAATVLTAGQCPLETQPGLRNALLGWRKQISRVAQDNKPSRGQSPATAQLSGFCACDGGTVAWEILSQFSWQLSPGPLLALLLFSIQSLCHTFLCQPCFSILLPHGQAANFPKFSFCFSFYYKFSL